MFKSQRVSTKLVLLCSLFVGAIVLATYSLIQEKQLAISFVGKELIGTQYLEALRGVYAAAVEAMLTVSDREHSLYVRSSKHDGEAALIAIQDTGPGIGPDDAKRIFEAFFTTKSPGMGMGLSICRSIVESLGGRILVSKAGQYGSVFEVILPGVNAAGAQ